MRFQHRPVTVAMTTLAIVGTAWAQQPIAYPAKGQSPQQQQQDQGQCYRWAKANTGIDPAAVTSASLPPSGPAVGGGERVGGAARGALGGAAIGAITGDAGTGAGIGAVAGTLAGGHRARQNRQDQQTAAQNQQREAINTFNRAYAACLKGRGYTVK